MKCLQLYETLFAVSDSEARFCTPLLRKFNLPCQGSRQNGVLQGTFGVDLRCSLATSDCGCVCLLRCPFAPASVFSWRMRWNVTYRAMMRESLYRACSIYSIPLFIEQSGRADTRSMLDGNLRGWSCRFHPE